MINPNVIIVWSGTNASIPSGFVRETSLDGKYPKGTANGTNPDDTGGTSTHTHTSPDHTHNINAHTHTYTLTNTTGPTQGCAGGGNTSALDGNHNHTGTSGAASAGTSGATGVTYAAYSSEPPYHEVIFIKPNTYQKIPNGALIYWGKSTTVPTGFYACDGTNSTPDLRNKYLRGATTGANAGGTGGSLTNTHTIAHTHTAGSHTHAAADSGGQFNEGGCNAFWYNYDLIYRNHVHSISMASASAGITAYDGAIGQQAETVEPAYTKLNIIQNGSGSALLTQPGMVAMWLGTLATIPFGWVLCDGTNGTTDMRSRHLKIANALNELGNTGGANTHTHAAQTHSHTASGSHTHTATGVGHTNWAGHDGSGASPPLYTNSHGQSVTAGTTNYGNSTTTAESSNNEPPYRTVAYIQFRYEQSGAGVISQFI